MRVSWPRRVSVSARRPTSDVGEPERTDLRRGRYEQRLPAERGVPEQQSVLVGCRVDVSRPAPLARAASDDVGERSRQLHAVEIDEQRRRSVFQLAGGSDRHHEGLGPLRRRPAASPGDFRHREYLRWRRRRRCGSTSAMDSRRAAWCRTYSALPFNITSGVANLQATNSRPLADGATASPNFDVSAVKFIPRNAGIGNDFFSLNLRISRAFRVGGDVKVEGLVDAFNVTNRRQQSHAKPELRSGSLSRRTRCRRSTRSPQSVIREPSSSDCD